MVRKTVPQYRPDLMRDPTLWLRVPNRPRGGLKLTLGILIAIVAKYKVLPRRALQTIVSFSPLPPTRVVTTTCGAAGGAQHHGSKKRRMRPPTSTRRLGRIPARAVAVELPSAREELTV